MKLRHEWPHNRRHERPILSASVILFVLLLATRTASALCPTAITGPDTTLANASVEYALWHPIYQTFKAADAQLQAVTVWRTAALDSATLGILVTVVATDGTGRPLPANVLQTAAGPEPSPFGDGIHPTPIRIVFTPPVTLSAGTRYALAFHQVLCSVGAFYDLQAISGASADPALPEWRDNGRHPDCTLPSEQPQLEPGLEIIQHLEFCGSSPVSTNRTSWGGLKSHYR